MTLEVSVGFIAVIILVAGIVLHKQALLVASALAWTAYAFWNRTETPTWGTWDIHELLFYLGIGMVILSVAEALLAARKPADPLIGERTLKIKDRGLYEDLDDVQGDVDRIRGKRRRTKE